MRLNFYHFLYGAFLLFIVSCSKPNNYSNPNTEIVKEFRIMLSTDNENHPVNESFAASQFLLQIYGDTSTIRYDIFVDSARAFDDYVTGVELRLGSPIMDNGTLLMDLPGKYPGPSATGILNGVRRGLIDTLLNKNIDVYVNVVTRKYPTGLMRGQLNNNIIFSARKGLSGQEVVPSVATGASGTVYMRLVEETRMLYTKIDLVNDAPDVSENAKIYKGLKGASGTEFLTVIGTSADFGKPSLKTLTPQEYEEFLASPLYLSVNSASFPAGKLRTQLK